MISASNLTKRFGSLTAVDHISFDIPKGQVVGFLGPNGAGKTTTMRLLTAYLPADEGECRVMGRSVGENPMAVRRSIGYLPENNPLYEDFEVVDTLNHAALLRGMTKTERRQERVRAAIKACGLKSAVGKKVSELSKGYRQRLGLACAIIHDPDVLILDEPTSGLDPNQVVEVRELIRELKKEKTLLLSTHILSEVTATCDRVIIISGGKIAADGSPAELSGSLQNKNRLYIEMRGPVGSIAEALTKIPGAARVQAEGKNGGSGFIVESEAGTDLRERVFDLASANRWPILELKQEKLSLEDVFRRLTGKINE
ncbi:MAG: ATP-binding cassette domain-containing protein [Elusimicrobiota bacterium]